MKKSLQAKATVLARAVDRAARAEQEVAALRKEIAELELIHAAEIAAIEERFGCNDGTWETNREDEAWLREEAA